MKALVFVLLLSACGGEIAGKFIRYDCPGGRVGCLEVK